MADWLIDKGYAFVNWHMSLRPIRMLFWIVVLLHGLAGIVKLSIGETTSALLYAFFLACTLFMLLNFPDHTTNRTE